MSLNAFVYIATSLGGKGINTYFGGACFAEKIHKESSSKSLRNIFQGLFSVFFPDKNKKEGKKKIQNNSKKNKRSRNNKSEENAAMVVLNLNQA